MLQLTPGSLPVIFMMLASFPITGNSIVLECFVCLSALFSSLVLQCDFVLCVLFLFLFLF